MAREEIDHHMQTRILVGFSISLEGNLELTVSEADSNAMTDIPIDNVFPLHMELKDQSDYEDPETFALAVYVIEKLEELCKRKREEYKIAEYWKDILDKVKVHSVYIDVLKDEKELLESRLQETVDDSLLYNYRDMCIVLEFLDNRIKDLEDADK